MLVIRAVKFTENYVAPVLANQLRDLQARLERVKLRQMPFDYETTATEDRDVNVGPTTAIASESFGISNPYLEAGFVKCRCALGGGR